MYIVSCRDYGEGVFEMMCKFQNFDVEILRMPLAYKYVIYSPKMKTSDDCYEYLHAHSPSYWREYNRCLVIRTEYLRFPTGKCIGK